MILRISYEYAGFAATTSTTRGGEDTFNPSSVESKRDSLRYSDDGSQGSESDTSSEDQRSNEDGVATSTEESSDHHFDFPFEFPDEKGSKADTNRASVQLRSPDGNQNGIIAGSQRSFSTPEREQGSTWPDL